MFSLVNRFEGGCSVLGFRSSKMMIIIRARQIGKAPGVYSCNLDDGAVSVVRVASIDR